MDLHSRWPLCGRRLFAPTRPGSTCKSPLAQLHRRPFWSGRASQAAFWQISAGSKCFVVEVAVSFVAKVVVGGIRPASDCDE